MEKEKTKWKCLSSAFKQRSPTWGPVLQNWKHILPSLSTSATSVYGGWEWKAWETLGPSSLKNLYLVVRDFALRRESIWHVTKSCESTEIWKGAYHSIVVCSPPYLKYFCNTYIYKIPSLFSSSLIYPVPLMRVINPHLFPPKTFREPVPYSLDFSLYALHLVVCLPPPSSYCSSYWLNFPKSFFLLSCLLTVLSLGGIHGDK